MLTAAGSGYSRWRDIAVTRWREDATRDCWGSYIFLRDAQTGEVWSAGYQPSGIEPDAYEVSFYEDRAEFIRRDRALTTTLEVVVSPEDDAEVRRVSITNLGTRTREIQVTSYAELCLASQAADVAHPAFSNLFVQTEFVPDVGALLATRRRQSDKETAVWAAHVVAVEGETVGDLQFETDRSRFIGRGHDMRNPVSIIDGRPLSNTVGSVLDPVISLRRTVRIPPGTTARVVFSTIVAPTREQVLELADKYRGPTTVERTLGIGLDTGTGTTSSPGYRPRRSPLIPETRKLCALLRRFLTAIFRCAQPQHTGAFRAVGPRNLRRFAHCSGAHR